MSPKNQLVINWHVTEACNYNCNYCYATWTESQVRRELINDTDQAYKFLGELYRFFHPDNDSNPLKQKFTWDSVRLNLAGGEPLLLRKKLPDIIRIARQLGFEISIISNGSLLNSNLVAEISSDITMLGVSIDSVSPLANIAIGRADRSRRLLNIDELSRNIITATEINPDLKIKINTVVNSLNHGENMTSVINTLTPDRWKVLRMLPVVNSNLAVSDHQFQDFVNRHIEFSRVIRVEDNDEMQNSYIMVDPKGRFFQNSPISNGNSGYEYSESIMTAGAEQAYRDITFSSEKFLRRYDQDQGEQSDALLFG